MGYCLLDSHLPLASIFQSISLSFLLTFWLFCLGSPVGPVHFHIQFFLLNPSVLHSTICLSHQSSHLLLRASRIKSSFDDFLVLLKSKVQFSSVQSLSRSTLCNPMNCSMPGLPVHHQLPEFTQTHLHRVGDAIQPPHPLSSPSPPAPNPSQHQGLFQ